jgi:hypothetical protein
MLNGIANGSRFFVRRACKVQGHGAWQMADGSYCQ